MDRRNHNILETVINAQKNGNPLGVYSICSANPYVIEAAMRRAYLSNQSVLIEATSNQVNQYGGYMGLTPLQFRNEVFRLARNLSLPYQQIILGGDHLGPGVWQKETEATAMGKAAEMIESYIKAGFRKIHIDASMKLADDPPGPLSPSVAAYRTALLCRSGEIAAEVAVQDWPVYVIGTEVPTPGGAKEEAETIEVTPVERAHETIELTKDAFYRLGLGRTWERVVALVVQPGVEFADASIHEYERERTGGLSKFIENIPGLVYEAHSTDYQTSQSLRRMVEDHFAILKVGPALTYAFREAVFALELIEIELYSGIPSQSLSNLGNVVEAEMIAYPEYWSNYYHGSPSELRLARRFSFSDRIRYYWVKDNVMASLERLFSNLHAVSIPMSLISQFFPVHLDQVRSDKVGTTPRELIDAKIGDVIEKYRYACLQ